MQNGKGNDDFWDLGEFESRAKRIAEQARKSYSADTVSKYVRQAEQIANEYSDEKIAEYIRQAQKARNSHSSDRTSAVEINDDHQYISNQIDKSETVITKFVPPHSDPSYKKKHVIFEYEPQNTFIKCVRFLSDRKDDKLFSLDNLFMRERAALLDRTAIECEYVPFYSYAPRYSQLTKPQLKYYLWWRDNARRGTYLAADESYIMLYAYELAATGDGEDKQAALYQLCSLLMSYPAQRQHLVFKTMIRDIICDFCLVHRLTPPQEKLIGVERQVINNSFLPEMFVDLNMDDEHLPSMINTSMSLYDYTKSKFYPDNKELFDRAILGSVCRVIRSKESFNAITSFTRGVYGSVTSERHPFGRMVNIVNKNVSVEVTYFELTNIRPAITDIVRYSENRLREHIGIKNKISIMSVNPIAKDVVDAYFDTNFPARPAIDKRRRDARIDEHEVHEYDKFYDLPRTELSPERAMEIERQSWDTTKILTDAFEDEQDTPQIKQEETLVIHDAPVAHDISLNAAEVKSAAESPDNAYQSIKAMLGDRADFIRLCKSGASLTEQRKFALSLGLGVDEIADTINEAALDVVGDIILESNGVSYIILEDYMYLFDDL